MDLPDELTFHLTRRSETLNLNLRRNYDINPNADVYFAQTLKNGKFGLVPSSDIETENLAYYQDIENGAFMTVRCVKKSNEQCDRIINGNIRIGDRDYVLQPAETGASSRYMLEDPGVFGRQYVLQVESHPLREHSFKNKDAAHEMEENIGEKRMTVTQHLNEQLKQKHSSLLYDSFSDRNQSTIQRDKSRQLPKIYYVKMAIVIDRALWDFYYSTAHSYSSLTRRRNAIQVIHQYYSHIMNGVNMLYKGISDPSIRINVILNQFIIWRSKHDFRHHLSSVITYKDQDHIDEVLYLHDIIDWDNTTAVRDEPSFSHGMVFTSYKLYDTDLDNAATGGLCYNGEVCNIGKRMSIVERRGYVWTVRSAAHELGHSLGAFHDGEAGAEACKAEDSFIMSPSVFENYPGQPYDKNPWLFSTCSIDAFKRTLPNKECVRDVGHYYNNAEYHQFLAEEPGQAFAVHRQCELIHGHKSVLCETDRRDVCLLMRCTDPSTGVCLPTYHGAARGTDCGKDLWCIDGRCVDKR
ncbi:hypothetical protein ACJMK2_022248, partial [Sinanodonta woodiana]